MIRFRPEERFTIDEVLRHPWLHQPLHFINSYGCMNPIEGNKKESETNVREECTNKSALRRMEEFGYPQCAVLESLRRNELNHASATYKLLVMK